MLEARIEELTAAVKALTEMMSVRVTSQPVPEVVKEPKETKKPRSAASSTGPDAVSEQAPAVAEQPSTQEEKTTIDTSLISEPEFNEQLGRDPVTYDHVKKATNALSAAKGRDVTIDALSRFGVKRATELDEGQWTDYIAYAETVIADDN